MTFSIICDYWGQYIEPKYIIVHVPYSEDHSILELYKTATNMPDPSTYTYVDDVAV